MRYASAFAVSLTIMGSLSAQAHSTMKPQTQSFDYSKRKNLTYAHADGHALKMTLYLPEDDGCERRPGMVLIHGGAWMLRTRYRQAWYCRQFARAGFVVMTIDYRVMPQHAFPACVHDCKAAVRWLRLHADEFNVEPSNIVAFGVSSGGYLAAFLATTTPEDGLEGTENPGASSEVRAAVSLYGPMDLTCYRDLPLHKPLGRISRRFIADFSSRDNPVPGADSLEAASPITYARSTTSPILFVHGEKDKFVHFEQSRRFHARLRELGVHTRLIGLPGRGHGFDFIHLRQRRAIFGDMLSFLHEAMSGTDEPVRSGRDGRPQVTTDGFGR